MTLWPDQGPQPHMFLIEGQVTPGGEATFVGVGDPQIKPGAHFVVHGSFFGGSLAGPDTFEGSLLFTGPGGHSGDIFMVQEVSEVPAPER